MCVLSVFLLCFFGVYLLRDFDRVFRGHLLWLRGDDD